MTIYALTIAALLHGTPNLPQFVQDPSPPRKLFNSYIPKPTGLNGYEDFIRAADLAVEQPFRETFNRAWSPENKDLLLNRYRAVKAVSQPILRLIRQGNDKPCRDPRVLTFDTTFEEFSRFRNIAKALASCAYCEFADGNIREGTRIVLDTMRFADRFQNDTIIAKLVSRACRAIVIAILSDNISSLGLPEAELLEKYAIQALETAASPERYVLGELAFAESALNNLLREQNRLELLELIGIDAEENANELTVADKAMIDRVKKMDNAEFAGLIKGALEQIKLESGKTLEIFGKPEREWKFNDDDSSESLESQIASSLSPVWQAIASTLIIERTQFRLMILHCKIISYRWLHGRLPSALSEAAPPGMVTDPLTSKPFLFEAKEEGRWTLQSEGTSDTGPIGLRYKKVFSEEAGAPEPPAVFKKLLRNH